MKSQKQFRFFFRLAKDISLELLTNTPETGRFIHRFLFPKKLSRAEKQNKRIIITSETSHRSFRLSDRGKEFVETGTLSALLPALDQLARRIILKHLPAHFFPIHSAALVQSKTGLLLIGESTCGKSDTLARLIPKNFEGLSDEFNILDLRSLRLFPYCRTWAFRKRLPCPFCHKPHVKVSGFYNARGKKIKNPNRIYLNTEHLRFALTKRGIPLRQIFFLKTRHSRTARCYKVPAHCSIEWLAQNAYFSFFKRAIGASYARMHRRILRRFFHQLPKLLKAVTCYEVQVGKSGLFSQLIYRKCFTKIRG